MLAHSTAAFVGFIALSALLIGVLLATMHVRHRYEPNLIGALIGALLCFALLETIPALI
jgi:hypothetical protein